MQVGATAPDRAAMGSSFPPALAVAITLHAGALATVGALSSRLVVPRPPVSPPSATAASEVDVGIVEHAPTVTATETAVAASAVAAQPRAARRRAEARLASLTRESAVPEFPAPAPAEEAPKDGLPGAPSSAPRLSLAELGLEGDRRVGLSRFPRSRRESTPVAPGVEASMARAVAERDRTIGLGPGGPILTALERVAYRRDPPDGRARFVATLDPGGRVLSVRVLEVSEGHPAWEAVARGALAALRQKRLRVPAGSDRGVRLEIEVESRVQLPSGLDPGAEISLLGVPIQEGGKRSPKIDILKPRLDLEMVEVPLPGGGSYRAPALVVQLDVFAAHGDLSDIGAEPRRVVRARIVDQRPL